MADIKARGTIPRFIALPLPDELLFNLAKIVNETIEEYWKEMEDDDEFSFSDMTFEEIMEDVEAKPYVNYCFRISQKMMKAYMEEIEVAQQECHTLLMQ